MSTKINVLQVIPKLGYGGAETGCYDIAHFLSENECGSFLATSGGELLKFVKKDKVKLLRLPVHSKNPLLIIFNALMLTIYILIYKINIVHARSRAPAWVQSPARHGWVGRCRAQARESLRARAQTTQRRRSRRAPCPARSQS